MKEKIKAHLFTLPRWFAAPFFGCSLLMGAVLAGGLGANAWIALVGGLLIMAGGSILRVISSRCPLRPITIWNWETSSELITACSACLAMTNMPLTLMASPVLPTIAVSLLAVRPQGQGSVVYEDISPVPKRIRPQTLL